MNRIGSTIFLVCAVVTFVLSAVLDCAELTQCAIFAGIIAIYYNTK